MNAEVLKATLKRATKTQEPILIVSEPGNGKTDIVCSLAEDPKEPMDIAIFHPAVEEPTDVKGFPWCFTTKDGSVKAKFVTYGEMERILNPVRPMIAFIDDIGQSTEQMQAAWMQPLHARELNGHKIGDNVTFIGATNDIKDKAGVMGFIEPLKSRFTSIVRYSPTEDDWVAWAYDHAMPDMLISFIRQNGKASLNKFEPTKELKNSPCPRTVAAAGRIITQGYPEAAIYELLEGACGTKWAADFVTYRDLHSQMPDVDALLADPENSPVDFGEPGIEVAVAVALVRKANDKNLKSVITYIDRMKREFGVMAIKDIRRANKNVRNHPDYREWLKKNAKLISN